PELGVGGGNSGVPRRGAHYLLCSGAAGGTGMDKLVADCADRRTRRPRLLASSAVVLALGLECCRQCGGFTRASVLRRLEATRGVARPGYGVRRGMGAIPQKFQSLAARRRARHDVVLLTRGFMR